MLQPVFVLHSGNPKLRIGGGTLVDSDHVITCAHVLREAGYAPSKSGSLTTVNLDIGGTVTPAELLPSPWINSTGDVFPSDEDLPITDDVVLLKVAAKRVDALKLRTRRRVENGTFSAFGTSSQRPDGAETKFKMARVDTRGVTQLDWEGNGIPIEQGFSGSPVEDDQGFVLGMIVSRWKPEKNDQFASPLAYMLPIETVAATVKSAEEGFDLGVESPLLIDYPSTRELFEWAWNRLRSRKIGPATSRDLLELSILIAKSPIEEEHADTSVIDQLISGSLEPSLFERVSSSEFVENERQFVYMKAAGGSGKSFFLYRSVIAAIHSEVVPFFVDVRGLSSLSASDIQSKLGGKLADSLDYLINDFGVHSGAEKFRLANQQKMRSLILIDGLNETTQGSEQLVRLLQAIPNNYDHVSVIVADRLALRFEYPLGFHLATVEPVSDRLIERVLKERQAAPVSSRILKLPFFLDLYLQDPTTLSEGKRAELVLEFVRRSLVGHNVDSAQAASDTQLNAVSVAAFRWYEKYKTTFATSSQVEGLLPASSGTSVGMLISSGLLVSRIGSVGSGDQVEFQHQLIHDYLAARYFVQQGMEWSAINFKNLTLDRQSADALVFAREIIEAAKGTSAADDFITAVYDWDYPSALACLQVEDEPGGSRPIRIAISALVAEKIFEPFLHSRQSAETQLPNIRRGLLLDRDLPTDIKDLIRHVENLKTTNDEVFGRWRQIYTKSGRVDDQVIEALVGDNPLMGWTAANVIRRLELTEAGLASLKMALTMTAKGLSPAVPSALRWRIYHALGAHYGPFALQALWEAAWSGQEHEDTRYGAARSLVELAIHAPGEHDRIDILNRIAQQIRQLSDDIGTRGATNLPEAVRGMGAFRKCSILKAKKSEEPSWWGAAYLPILDAGIELFQKLGSSEAKRWEEQKDRFLREDRLAIK